MFFNKFFAFAKKPQSSAECLNPIDNATDKAEDPKVVVEAAADIEPRQDEDVHVRMLFDEHGNMVLHQVEHINSADLSYTSSTASTLVGLPTALKPSLDSKPPNVSHQSDRVSSQARPSDDAPASPTKISMEQFTIIRELGNGAYGVVYLVQDRVTKKISALKTVSKGTSVEQDGSYSSIRKEQAILERLGVDSAFVNLQASWEDDTYFYFLMDYYSGGDLFDKLRMYGPIPEPQAKRYFAQLLLAVEKLQKLRIIHCDIKVENILFSSNDDAILADFGLAAEFGRTPAQSSAHDEDDHLDKFAGDWVEICGTGLYFSPLVLSTFKMTYNSDLWALAVVLYAMLLDKLPFGLDELTQEEENDLDKVAHKIIDRPLEIDEHATTSQAASLLRMMLNKDANQRPTVDDIKKHSWFEDFGWDTVVITSSQTTSMNSETVTSPFNSVIFEPGSPYPDGKEPHPQFYFISPTLLEHPPTTSISPQCYSSRSPVATPCTSTNASPSTLQPVADDDYAPYAVPPATFPVLTRIVYPPSSDPSLSARDGDGTFPQAVIPDDTGDDAENPVSFARVRRFYSSSSSFGRYASDFGGHELEPRAWYSEASRYISSAQHDVMNTTSPSPEEEDDDDDDEEDYSSVAYIVPLFHSSATFGRLPMNDSAPDTSSKLSDALASPRVTLPADSEPDDNNDDNEGSRIVASLACMRPSPSSTSSFGFYARGRISTTTPLFGWPYSDPKGPAKHAPVCYEPCTPSGPGPGPGMGRAGSLARVWGQSSAACAAEAALPTSQAVSPTSPGASLADDPPRWTAIRPLYPYPSPPTPPTPSTPSTPQFTSRSDSEMSSAASTPTSSSSSFLSSPPISDVDTDAHDNDDDNSRSDTSFCPSLLERGWFARLKRGWPAQATRHLWGASHRV